MQLKLFILFYLEEATAALFAAMSLLGIRPSFKSALMLGVQQGAAVCIIRSIYTFFGIPEGTQVLFTILAMLLLVKFNTKRSWGVSGAITLMSFVFIVISETLMYPLALEYFHLTLETAHKNLYWYIVTSYIGDSIVFLLAGITALTGLSLTRKDIKKANG